MILETLRGMLDALHGINNKLCEQESVLKPPHSLTSQSRADKLHQTLQRHGWMGVGLVVGTRGHLLTGTHRYCAAKMLGMADSEVPTISIKEVCRLGKVDINSLQYGGVIKRGTAVFDEIIKKLPGRIRRKYGL